MRVDGEGGRVAEREGEMGKTRGGGKMEREGQTEGRVQTETSGRTEELVVTGKCLYMPCRHTNTGTHTR